MDLDPTWIEDGIGPAAYWDARWDATRARSLLVRSSGEERISETTVGAVALRALVDGAWGFASVDEAARGPVGDAAADAVRLARALSGKLGHEAAVGEGPSTAGTHALGRGRDPFAPDPVELLGELRQAAALLPRTVEGAFRFSLRRETKHILGAHGADVRTEVTRVYAAADLTDKATGVSVGRRLGGTGGLELVAPDALEAATHDALAALERQVEARPLPRERLPVVVDPELAGVFAHEAVGHGCEADLVLAGESLFERLMGQRVGSDEVTIVDDPMRATGYGAIAVDDEGTLARPRSLVERGVVKGLIHSLETAARMGHAPNGGARAQDGQSEPIPRMSNTMMLGGSYTEDELWERAGRCIYVKGTRGGQVDTTRGTFQFTPQEAYLVEDGEVVHAVEGAGLSGTVLATLASVEGATRVERLGGPGLCGKGQWVPVGDGGPHILVREVNVG